MADSTNYHYHLIRQYLLGQMSPAEMHAFERSMLDDPFLADALDGFRKADDPTIQLHLDQIEAAIAPKETTKIAALPTWRQGLKVAAIFITLVATGSLAYYFYTLSPGQQQIAPSTVAYAESLSADSVGPATETSELKFSAKRKRQTPPKPPFVEHPAEVLAQASAETSDALPLAAQVADSTLPAISVAPTQPKALVARVASRFRFEGKIVDPEGEPIPFATIKSANNIGTVSDGRGQFSLSSADSVLEVHISSEGFEPTTSRLLASRRSLKITLQPTEETGLAELVVGSLAREKQDKITINTTHNAAHNPQPETGWTQYQKFASGYIQAVKDTAEEYINTEVTIEFDIDPIGRPINIQVVEPAIAHMAHLARQLIEAGPSWKKVARNKKIRLTISF